MGKLQDTGDMGQIAGYRILGVNCRIQDTGGKFHWIQDTEGKLQDTRYRGLNSRIQDTGVKLQDTRYSG